MYYDSDLAMWFSFLIHGLDPKSVLPPPLPPSEYFVIFQNLQGNNPLLFLPDNSGPVIDSRRSCVPHSLNSIILDHRYFVEAGGDLIRAKQVLF